MTPRLLRSIRTLHSWIGFLILPWIILYGFTGFYLNHSKAINTLLMPTPYDESSFVVKPETEWLSVNEARQKAAQIWADEPITKAKAIEYHGFVAIQFTKPSGNVIVSIKTGHYYKKTRLYRYTYDHLGSLVDRKIYWSYVFRYFHEVGWIDSSFGVWFADITAIALVLFGASGLILFIVPRQKKLKRNLSALLLR